MKNPKDSSKELTLDLINGFSKVSGYKINAQKSGTFLYTNNDTSEKIMKYIPLTIASKTIKYLGINLPKKVNNLHNKKYKTLLEKTHKENTNKWKNTLFPWIERVNIVKISCYQKPCIDSVQFL